MSEYYPKELAVCGFEAVTALAAHHPEKISRLFFAGNRAKHFSAVCKYLAKEKRLYRLVQSDSELEKLCSSVHHQGVVAMISVPVIPPVTKALITQWEKERRFVLLLDRIGNANNLGAIVRSAAFFGITELVITDDDAQAQLTSSAYRVAQGGMEFVNIYKADTAEHFLQECSGRLIRIGADHRAYRAVKDIPAIIGTQDAAVVVLGNEEHGIASAAKQKCDVLVKIRGNGTIESLNVAQAGTLFLAALAEIAAQRQQQR
ncbi:MAG: TrmH family RNA methyltransferase [Treponema sp.]